MADYNSPAAEGFPSHQRDRSGSMSLSLGKSPTNPMPPSSDNGGAGLDNASNGKPSIDGDGPPPAQSTPSSQQAVPPPAAANPEQLKQVTEVLSSEIGVATLLNRLKASIASAKEFALFLKKRSSLEEEHSLGLRKLSRMTQETMRRPDHRQGTFTQAYDEMMQTHERLAENGAQFAASLHQMHDDLLELAVVAERSRKGWKVNGLSAEQKVADMEQQMRKSKAKYDSLAEDYERARMGEARQSGKMFGALKGHKSAAQHEEDLLRKVQAADQTYHGHVQTLQAEKTNLETTTRPEAIKALQDLIRETDAGLSLQVQKFATFNEKLLLSNGLSVSPVKGLGGENSSQTRSLRQAASSINNEKDLSDYILSCHRNMGPNTGEVKYERHHVLAPQGSSMGHNPSGPVQQPAMAAPPPQASFQKPPGPGSRTSTMGMGPLTGNQVPQVDQGFQQSGVTAEQARPFSQPQPPQPQPHNRSFSQGNPLSAVGQGPQHPFGSHPPEQSGGRYGGGHGGSFSSSGPPRLGALPFQEGPPQQSTPPGGPSFQPPHERTQSAGVNLRQAPAPTGRTPPPYAAQGQGFSQGSVGASAPPTAPVFGLTLNRLYERDGLAVPMVVYQCIQAVDLFGLGVEGIYRQSGSMNHVQKLKAMFDNNSSNPALDFRNPENFYHDVNSVTGLLKQFFRDLPDPLLTMEHHDSFIAAAKHEDDTVRRDSLHAIINSLPDPNYASLRALTLHLYRVMDNSHVNRMNSHNLAVIFGPTLMGTDPSTAIADAGWQIKVIDTILQNTYQIFDED